MPLVTRERAALPQPLWLAVVVACGIVVALRPSGPPRWWPDAAFTAAIGFGAAAAFLAPGQVLGHDTLHHIWGAWGYLQAWDGGDVYPIWLHHVGLGMPLPMFYGPLPYWVMLPFALAGGGPAHLLSASLVLAAVVAALTAWWAAGRWTGDRRAALVAGIAWAYAPYRLLDANYRAALGESWALAWMPLVLVAFDRLLTGGGRRWVAASAVALALVTITHPLSLVLLAVVLPTLALARLRALLSAGRPEAVRRLTRCVGGGLSGLALAGFFALPLAVELGSLSVEPLLTEGPPKYSQNAVDPRQVLERRLWSAMEWARPDDWAHPEEREMPIYFGLVALAALLGAAVVRSPESAGRGVPLGALAAVGVVAFALPFRPVVHLTISAVRDLGLLQYPWRYFGPAAAAAALALGGLAVAPRASPTRGWLLASFLALAALGDGFAYSGAVARAERWQGLAMPDAIYGTGVIGSISVPEPWPERVFGLFFPPWACCAPVAEAYSEFPEYFTPAARRSAARFRQSSVGLVEMRENRLREIESFPFARLWRSGDETPQALEYRRASGTVVVRMPPGASGRIEVAEAYFPGWQVETGGQWSEVDPSEDGFLAVEVPSGAAEIRFRFHRWRWDRTAGWILSLATATWLAVALRRRRTG